MNVIVTERRNNVRCHAAIENRSEPNRIKTIENIAPMRYLTNLFIHIRMKEYG